MVNWKNLLEEHEEGIIEKLEQAYEEACIVKGKTFKLNIAVVLDSEGELSIHHLTQGSTPMDVWNGESIYVGIIEEFIPWENNDEREWIEPDLTEKEKENFQSWLDENWMEGYCFSSLENWNSTVYERVVKNSIDAQFVAHASDWAREQFDRVVVENSGE